MINARDKGKVVISGGGAYNANEIISSPNIHVPIRSTTLNTHAGSRDIILAHVNEAHAEKKRRCEGELSSTEEHMLVRYTITNNPLARGVLDSTSEHFLMAGPGSQAYQEQ